MKQERGFFCRSRLIRGSLFALLFCVSGCGAGSSIDCGPDDQRDTYMAPLPADQTVQVGVDPAFRGMGSPVLDAIQAAVNTWNDFSTKEVGYALFAPTYQPTIRTEVRTAVGAEFCESSSIYPDQFVILLEDSAERWERAGLNSMTPAITFRCTIGDQLAKQVVLVHREYTDPRQYQSLILHELGHAAGLDHSCNSQGDSSRFRSCEGLSEEHPYFTAVMYPVFRVGYSPRAITDIKHTLRSNDKERARCLYQGE